MKFFCVLLLVGVSNTLASLTAPEVSVEENDSEWKVVWKPVQSSDESDPVIGYKVRVKVYVKSDRNHIVDNPQEALFLEFYYRMRRLVNNVCKVRNKHAACLMTEQEILVNDTTELKVNLEPTVPYEFTVLALAKSGDGPASEPKKVTFSVDEE